jgi:hypothetical protein
MNTFYLGTHQTDWLARTDVPLFVSARRLRRRKSLPKAAGRWALDSGGFSELSMFGEWRTPAMQYASEARWWRDQIGGLDWAAAQDWMCEGFILAKTGFSVAEHQRRTVANYLLLKQLAPDLPWLPVLQGFTLREYRDCIHRYTDAGVCLTTLPAVGLGSICRRQGTAEAEDIVRFVRGWGIRPHGFGFKLTGLKRVHRDLESADSLAWSYAARNAPPLEGCTHASCANCIKFALRWREKVLRACQTPSQGVLAFEAA